ncbi:unnamed protein product [Ectocarpus sp. 12 AP-2014]
MAHSWRDTTHAAYGPPRALSATLAKGTAKSSFTCSLCGESFRVDYHGRKPPFCPQLVFMEDVYCMRDPFSVGGGGGATGENRKCLPTVVGGTCAVCSKDVCVQCSLLYAVRLCGHCARAHRASLPSELHRIVDATGGTPEKDPAKTGGKAASCLQGSVQPSVAIAENRCPLPPHGSTHS